MLALTRPAGPRPPALARRPSPAGPRPPARSHAPKPLSLLTLSLCLAASALSLPPARAGSYSGPSYTGGYAGPHPYALGGQSAPDYGGGGVGSAGAAFPCGGDINTSFAWMPSYPGEPLPQNVIVVQYGRATWSGALVYGPPQQSQPPPTGSCDDGLGDAPAPTAASDTAGAVSTGTHYKIMAGADPLTLPAVGALATVTSGGGPGGVTVDYSAAAYAVTIDLTGQTVDTDSSFQALTGQQITATFDTHGAPGTVSNYQWSTTGGHPFLTWDYVWPHPNYGKQFVPLTVGNYLNNQHGDISFYDAQDKDEVTTQCTATITFPDGTSAQITAKSQSVTFQKPTADNWFIDQPFGPAKMYDPNPDAGTGKTGGAFEASHLSSDIEVTEPSLFSDATGTCCLCQFVATDRRWYRKLDPLEIMDYPVEWNKLTVLNVDGTYSNIAAPSALDYGFPYPFGYRRNPDNTFTPVNGDYAWSASDLGFSTDYPSQSYELNVNDGGGNDWYESDANDTFTLWLMYRPPSNGQGTIYVPLQIEDWHWGGTAGTNSMMPGLWGVINEDYGANAPHNTDTYPSWTEQITGINPHP